MSDPGYLRTFSENKNATIAIIVETIENGPIMINEYASIRCSIMLDLFKQSMLLYSSNIGICLVFNVKFIAR